ncbi:hypothetical protein ACSQ67_000290 [Phaseolus vulgaris]
MKAILRTSLLLCSSVYVAATLTILLPLNLDGLLFPHAIPLAYDAKRLYFVSTVIMAFIFAGAILFPASGMPSSS